MSAFTENLHRTVTTAASERAETGFLWRQLSTIEPVGDDEMKCADSRLMSIQCQASSCAQGGGEKQRFIALRRAIHDHVSYVSADNEPSSVMYHVALIEGRTNCLGFSMLFQILGLRLGLALEICLAPEHCYLSAVLDGVAYDSEAGEQSGLRPAGTMKKRIESLDPAAGTCGAYFRPLDTRQVFACLLLRYTSHCVFHLRRKHAYLASVSATRLFPQLAETWHNQAVTAMLLGYTRKARVAFEQSARLRRFPETDVTRVNTPSPGVPPFPRPALREDAVPFPEPRDKAL